MVKRSQAYQQQEPLLIEKRFSISGHMGLAETFLNRRKGHMGLALDHLPSWDCGCPYYSPSSDRDRERERERERERRERGGEREKERSKEARWRSSQRSAKRAHQPTHVSTLLAHLASPRGADGIDVCWFPARVVFLFALCTASNITT
jgi:hypothetical protein